MKSIQPANSWKLRNGTYGTWGDDLRVDPLTNEFATVAASWRETIVDAAGHSVTETGYFTGLAEYREGHWQFRNAHWSAPVSSHELCGDSTEASKGDGNSVHRLVLIISVADTSHLSLNRI